MLIGIDGGGTKTALVLAEENGRLLNTVKGLGSNPADIGLEECENRLRSELDELLRGFGAALVLLLLSAALMGAAWLCQRSMERRWKGIR